MTDVDADIPVTLSPGARRGRWRGMHLIMTLGECDPVLVDSRDALCAFVERLVDAINMVSYGGPICERFGKGDLAGETVLQLIETSNIDIHGFRRDGSLCLHVFSCRRFDPEAAAKFTADYFQTDLHELSVTHSHVPERITS
jgi:S-adenosylmethionine/arginine decarboxylase-like enzyme